MGTAAFRLSDGRSPARVVEKACRAALDGQPKAAVPTSSFCDYAAAFAESRSIFTLSCAR